MEWMILPLKRYFDFQGRSRRKEFWMWVLFVIIVSIVLSILDSMLGLGGSSSFTPQAAGPGQIGGSFAATTRGGWLTDIFVLAILIPNIAVAVRRLHDTDRSGWWVLLPTLPYCVGAGLMLSAAMTGAFGAAMILGSVFVLVGLGCAILLLVWYCTPGTAGPNRFGPDPKDPGGAADAAEVFS